MSKTTAIPAGIETVADLARWLGDVPLDRICMRPPPGLATEKDVLAARRTPERWLCELVGGVLIRKAADFCAAAISVQVMCRIMDLPETRHSGVMLAGSMPYRLAPGLVRIPDGSFIPWDHFPGGELIDEEIGTIMPTLVFEVVANSDGKREIERKRDEYFQAGVEEVWIVDSVRQDAAIWFGPTSVQRFEPGDTIQGSALFPEVSIHLGKLFECLIHPRDRKSS